MDEPPGIWSRAQEGHLPRTVAPRNIVVLRATTEVGRLTTQAAWLRGHHCVVEPSESAADEKIHVLLTPPLLERDEDGDACEEPARQRLGAFTRAVTTFRPGRVILMSGIEAAGPLHIDAGPAWEGQEPDPVCTRGCALLAVEREAASACRRVGAELVILRAGHIWSAQSSGALGQLLGDVASGATRDLHETWRDHPLQPLHVDDLARAAALAIDRGSWLLHVTDHTPRSVGDLVMMLAAGARSQGLDLPDRVPPEVPAPASGRVHYLYPDHRARRELDWHPLQDVGAQARALLEPLMPRGAAAVVADEQTASSWARRLKREWQDRARSPNRDFYVASHAGWNERDAWERRAQEDARFVLAGIDESELRPAHVLEIGCGVGRLAAWIGPVVTSYSGVDIAPDMIRKAREDHAGRGSMRFVVGDGEAVPAELRDRSYSLVLCVAVLIHCPRVLIERMLADAWALVAPGGRLRFQVLADPADISDVQALEDARVIARSNRELETGGRPSDADRHVDETYYAGHRFDRQDLERLLRDAGISAYACHRLDPFHYHIDARRPLPRE